MSENPPLHIRSVMFEFHYRPQDAARPRDEMENTDRLEWAAGGVPIPNVGDTVSYDSWEHTGSGPTEGRDIVVARKIVSRHFYVHRDHIVVYFVVSDATGAEMRERLKE